MHRVAALVLAVAVVPVSAQTPKAELAPAGWSIATEGSGIPMGQNASEYAVETDREVFHGGKQALSIRSIVATPAKFRSITQFVKADAYRGKRVRLTGYLKTRDVADYSSIWMRIDGPTSMIAFDNMDRRAVNGTTDWTRHEVVLDVRGAFGTEQCASDLVIGGVAPVQIRAVAGDSAGNSETGDEGPGLVRAGRRRHASDRPAREQTEVHVAAGYRQ